MEKVTLQFLGTLLENVMSSVGNICEVICFLSPYSIPCPSVFISSCFFTVSFGLGPNLSGGERHYFPSKSRSRKDI